MSDVDSVTAYFTGTAIWLTVQAIPMLLAPRMIVTMVERSIREASDLEAYLLRALALALLVLAVYSLLLGGAFTLPKEAYKEHTTTATTIDDPVMAVSPSPENPLRKPTLVATTLYHLVTATGCYTRFLKTGQFTFLIGLLGAGVIGLFGVWCALFGDSQPGSKVRKSGFMFPSAEKREKKMQKREEKWSKKGL